MVEKIKRDKVVIIGSGGMLGSYLSDIFRDAVKLEHHDLDITQRSNVFETMSELKPRVVINAAAYTDVEKAEGDKYAAELLNATSVLYLSEACRQLDSILVHYSTDYVFDGENEGGYNEEDKTNPQNEYGRSKLGGELNIQRTMNNYYIIRTSRLFGKNGNNFVDTILKLAAESDEIRVVVDQFGCPTYCYDLAKMTKLLLEKNREFGIYHITNSGLCSWFEFAKYLLSFRDINCRIAPCDSSEYPSNLVRPKYSVLNNNKLEKMPHWKDAVRRYLSSQM